jgi:hypothetical protein
MTDVDVLQISFSELASWRKCQYQHWLKYRRRLTPIVMGAPLVRGIAWDEIMNQHYTGLMEAEAAGANRLALLDHPAWIARRNIIAGLVEPSEGDGIQTKELKELLHWMYLGYLERYGSDSQWSVLAVQHKGLARLWQVSTPTGIVDIRLKVIIDLIVRTRGRRPQVLSVDHKSTSSIGHNRDTDMDDQQGLYDWFVQTQDIWPGEPVKGTLLNYALARKNKQKPQLLEERFVRMDATRTPVELQNIAADAVESAAQAYTNPDTWQPPRSPHPEWCRRECEYLQACLAHRKGFDLDRFLSRTGFETPTWWKGDQAPLGLDEFLDLVPD